MSLKRDKSFSSYLGFIYSNKQVQNCQIKKITKIRNGVTIGSDLSDSVPNIRLIKGKAPLGA
jgi:hypothetical protein